MIKCLEFNRTLKMFKYFLHSIMLKCIFLYKMFYVMENRIIFFHIKYDTRKNL